MAIQIIDSPPSQPVALSDCFFWRFQVPASDAFLTQGTKATVVFTFNASPSAPADGTTFVLYGQTLQVQSAQDHTPYSFKVYSGDANATMNAFYSMLLSNYVFIDAADIEANFTSKTITMTWYACGAQENFASSQMDFSALASAFSAVATNGVTPVLRDNFRVLLRVLRRDNIGSGSGFVTAFEAITPQSLCSSLNTITFDVMPIARQLLKTEIPQIDSDAHPTVKFDGPLQYFAVQLGYTYNDGPAVKSGEFNFTSIGLVLNAYFEPSDAYKIRRFWPGAQGGLPPFQTHRRFLTAKPLYHRLLRVSRAWLWYMVNEAFETIGTLQARFVIDFTSSTTTYDLTVPNSGYGVNAINVSPQYVASLVGQPVSNIKSFFVAIRNNGVQITEATGFVLMDECKPNVHTDVYFLGKYGGIETLPVEIVEESVSQESAEAFVSIPCGAGRFNLAAYGGRTHSAVRSYTEYKLRVIDNRPDAVPLFKHMLASPQRWIRLIDDANKPIAWKVLVDPGSTTIRQSGSSVELLFTVKMNDNPVQRGNEPEF